MSPPRLVGVLLMALLFHLDGAARADYPAARHAGFRNCVIIYDKPVRGVRELLPYVARTPASGRTEWLFDAYLFCRFSTPEGIRTDSGPTRMADWLAQLDRWFGRDRDIAALDRAIAVCARAKAPPPRKVILTIPYPNPGVHDFGDVDGDGRSEDLATASGRAAAYRWYIAEARRRFGQARPRHLALWGFYWMSEAAPTADEPAIRQAAEAVHFAGGRFLWIPWFAASGWRGWRELGFDVAIMQPNHAFSSWTHHGRVRRSRLDMAASMARAAGMGVEIEAGAILTEPVDRQPYLHYLHDGAAGRLGYQGSAAAYYLSDSLVEDAAYSRLRDQRALYDALADYVSGKVVREPDRLRATVVRASGGDLLIRADLPRPRRVSELDVYWWEPAGGSGWVGEAVVRRRDTPSGPWLPGGWALRPAGPAGAMGPGVVTAPIGASCRQFEVRLRSRDGSVLPDPAALRLDWVEAFGSPHLALGAAYTMQPPPPQAYPDTGKLLTDGATPPGWGVGRTVGWSGDRQRVSVMLDLGRAVPVDRVEICSAGGGSGAVAFPAETLVMLGAQAPPPGAPRGAGPMPRGLAWASAGPVRTVAQRAANDLDGVAAAAFASAPRARYVTVSVVGGYWTMLSEIRIMSHGRNVALGASYRLQPAPTPAQAVVRGDGSSAPAYPDDGLLLTDGLIAGGFAAGGTAGWQDGRDRSFALDLGSTRAVREVAVWCLAGGGSAVFAPASVRIETSGDGVSWLPVAVVAPGGPPEDGRGCRAAAFRGRLARPRQARFVRVGVSPSRGWAMVSEVEVR
ncbi:MAG: DUF4855 domain-containing protein [Armatimonadetes bacterium]|nr:DUF4855 domain-containing protein [Armatimonadota bacterium]